MVSGGPKAQSLAAGSKTRGRERAGKKLWVVAARRIRFPDSETDWMGRLREMKEGWLRKRRRGGSEGVEGRGCQLEEIGSKL